MAGFKQIPGLFLVTKPPLFLLLLLIVEARWRTDGLTSEAVFLLNTGVVVPWLRVAELFPDEPKIYVMVTRLQSHMLASLHSNRPEV